MALVGEYSPECLATVGIFGKAQHLVRGETMAVEDLLRLRDELLSLGYYHWQIEDLLEQVAGVRKLTNLSPEQEEKIRKCLVDQIAFARRCMKIHE